MTQWLEFTPEFRLTIVLVCPLPRKYKLSLSLSHTHFVDQFTFDYAGCLIWNVTSPSQYFSCTLHTLATLSCPLNRHTLGMSGTNSSRPPESPLGNQLLPPEVSVTPPKIFALKSMEAPS